MSSQQFVRRAVDEITIEHVAKSVDSDWLMRVMANRENTVALRSAAQKRLQMLQRRKLRR